MQVFSKEWFNYHQSKLLLFVNNPIGYKFFNLKYHVPKKHKIVEITPNYIVYVDNAVYTKAIFPADVFARRLRAGLKPLWYFMHGWDFTLGSLSPKLDFGFNTLTVNPSAGHASTTCDQDVRIHNQDSTLATIRAGAGDEYGYTNFGGLPQYGRDGTRAVVALAGSGTTNQFAHLSRFLATFDTSSLGNGISISAAVISVFGAAQRANIGSPALHSCSATPSNNGDIVLADFSNVGSTSFGSIAYASFSTSAYNDITLNASGISNINKTGISGFGWRTDWDINNSFTGTWSADVSDLEFQTADGANAPKLVITYTINSQFPPMPKLNQSVKRAAIY